MHKLSHISVDTHRYKELLTAVAELSGLYSNSSTPFLHSRFVERLYVECSKSQDVARKDMSFDAIQSKRGGVGVKTFAAKINVASKIEKVAEFTKHATLGKFAGLSPKELAQTVAFYRNERVISDAQEFNIDLQQSIYHCLIRNPGGCFIHEEPFALIDTSAIRPTDKFGNLVPRWNSDGTYTHFTDGINQYSFGTAKNVLMKRFTFSNGINTEFMSVKILKDPLEIILSSKVTDYVDSSVSLKDEQNKYIVLPLYTSNKRQGKYLQEKAGINQWHAGGRPRKFGEAYVPVPAAARHIFPDFLPPRDSQFDLELPNGSSVTAKVCQSDGKALMSQPNDKLMSWLFASIDGSIESASKRLSEARPYTYEDLIAIGKDSVKVTALGDDQRKYRLDMMPIGSYEEFLAGINEV